MRETLAKFTDVSKLHGVVGDFRTDAEADQLYADVTKLLGGCVPQHVVSIIGFSSPIPTLASELTPEAVNANWEESLWPTVRANKAFIPRMKGQPGSFSVLAGGLAHFVMAPHLWSATLKNATIHTLGMALNAELKDTPLRYTTVCLHFGVSHFGGDKNKLGLPGIDTEKFGPIFVAIAQSKHTGLLCLKSPDDVKNFTEASK